MSSRECEVISEHLKCDGLNGEYMANSSCHSILLNTPFLAEGVVGEPVALVPFTC